MSPLSQTIFLPGRSSRINLLDLKVCCSSTAMTEENYRLGEVLMSSAEDALPSPLSQQPDSSGLGSAPSSTDRRCHVLVRPRWTHFGMLIMNFTVQVECNIVQCRKEPTLNGVSLFPFPPFTPPTPFCLAILQSSAHLDLLCLLCFGTYLAIPW
jgi:hypothetical protein